MKESELKKTVSGHGVQVTPAAVTLRIVEANPAKAAIDAQTATAPEAQPGAHDEHKSGTRPQTSPSVPGVIQDWIEEGRRAGRNGSYKPWLRVHDLDSRGRAERLTSQSSGERIGHLPSGQESHVFFIFEWDTNVVDKKP